MPDTVLITGASRGLGLEFARQYLEKGWRVLATARHPEGSEGLAELRQRAGEALVVAELDVRSEDSVAAAAERFEGEPVDVLVQNAGIMGEKGPLEQVGAAEVLRVFDANVLGALRVTKAFLANVEAGRQRKIAFITSMMGSIGDGPSGGYYPYRISKTALNMLGANLAAELRPRGIMVALLHPGWVRTRMGGEAAPTSAKDSVMGMRRVIAGLTPDDSGGFYHAEGHAVPW